MPKRQMLVNYVPGEDCRIAIVEDGRLEELYQERASLGSHVGNIYKGRVVNVEPSIQAAFIDFGLERNGFLHISDLHPMYFPGKEREETEMVGQKTPRRDRPPIQKCLRRGQEILVQVLKEGIGTKGPTLTSYLSIPGRFLVMMPHMERLGVSRKIEDDELRRSMRAILDELKPPEGFGFIIRTAGIGRTKTDLKRDLAYLQRLWKSIEARMKVAGNVGELYTESDLVIRTIRDVYTTDIERIIVDDPVAARRARDFLAIASPRSSSSVCFYRDHIPLFHRYDMERQIENISSRTVPLPSGGTLVIDQTEAVVAIDVNSGKYRDNRDAEMTAYKTNVEAADEICRQLRLRDFGGVIINDLIDMRAAKHRKDIEHRFKENLKRDRARTKPLPISQLGVLEMTRQRMRPSLTKSTYMPCPACNGAGQVKSPETVVLEVMRRLALAMQQSHVARIELTVSPDVAFQLLNRKRAQLVGMEQTHQKPVLVRVSGGGLIDFIDLAAFDARGSAVDATMVKISGEPRFEPIEDLPDSLAPDLEAEEEIEEIQEEAEASRAEATGKPAPAPAGAGANAAGNVSASAPGSRAGRPGPAAPAKPPTPTAAPGKPGATAGAPGPAPGSGPEPASPADDGAGAPGEGQTRRRRRRGGRRHRRRREREREAAAGQPGGAAPGEGTAELLPSEMDETGAGAGAEAPDIGGFEVPAGPFPPAPATGEAEELAPAAEMSEESEPAAAADSALAAASGEPEAPPGPAETKTGSRRRRGGRGRGGRGKKGGSAPAATDAAPAPEAKSEARPSAAAPWPLWGDTDTAPPPVAAADAPAPPAGPQARGNGAGTAKPAPPPAPPAPPSRSAAGAATPGAPGTPGNPGVSASPAARAPGGPLDAGGPPAPPLMRPGISRGYHNRLVYPRPKRRDR